MASTSNIIPSSASPTAVDVVVVGAGLSGLREALAIQAVGLSRAVVEATDRVGGKTPTLQSKKVGPGVNDLGAAWINDTSQSEMHKLVQRYRLQTVAQMDTGLDVHLHGDEVVMCPHGVLQTIASAHQVGEEYSGGGLDGFVPGFMQAYCASSFIGSL
ncbi:hypothetical protein PENARI_c034G02123 [Penicillium arizonense]|uniref:monoamine oxidase n=1 Tax=Penicillium arizonense TaxID=1835702 RepID=A0A1F5L436_PENAI|nr:hypothetical protein PENARI_c034G02123 [Penicillium arizonense]OGE47994.1 hypothetical protein PENARI_c034G02123 [Penicillium arizonense]